MTVTPRGRSHAGPIILSAGFRPFFLLGSIWAALAIPLWLALYGGTVQLPSLLPPTIWHVHEMVFGYGAAVVAGFLLTAIPNWTGRLPLSGAPLAGLVALWCLGRLSVLCSAAIGAPVAAGLDLAFPLAFLAAVAREIIAGRNWRNSPMLAALAMLLLGNLLVHLDAMGVTATGSFGDRLGVATLLMLITFVGGRIVPSFTRNWLVRQRPDAGTPAEFGLVDRVTLALVALALLAWLLAEHAGPTPWLELGGGVAVAVRLARWRGTATTREPLLWILHLGYAWLAFGFILLTCEALVPSLPPAAAVHALTMGAIGTMTLAVMTRATLGHTGRPLAAGTGTTTIYGLVTVATLARLAAPFWESNYFTLLCVAGFAWSGAFGLFAVLYARPLLGPRASGDAARPI